MDELIEFESVGIASMEVDFYEIEEDFLRPLKYVVLQVRYNHQWVVVRHKARETWEMPGGHIEAGEIPDEAARRELYEETGATEAKVSAVTDYGVTVDGKETFGRLYYCEVETFGSLPDFEIAEIAFYNQLPETKMLTYPAIQPLLYDYVKKAVGL